MQLEQLNESALNEQLQRTEKLIITIAGDDKYNEVDQLFNQRNDLIKELRYRRYPEMRDMFKIN